MTETPEEAVLLWAMHPGGSLIPDAHGVDTDALLRLALHHRVASRLLSQLEKKLLSGLSRLFVTRLRFVEHERRKRFREQIAYAQILAERFGSPENPVIFLKGFSSYGVTGDELLKRPVGDFDLMAANLPELYKALTANGFFGKRHFTHEYGKLSNGKETIDLHEFFPVRSYPMDDWNIDPFVMTLPATFDSHQLPDLPADLVETGVYYDDLLRHSQKGIAPGTERLTFPTPEMACLILCAHSFRNVTITLHYLGEEVLLRLGEFVDANTLASMQSFNHATFAALVEQYNATDSVTWVARQCERFFGQTFLPHLGVKANRTALTVEHLSMGNWIYLGEPPLQIRSGSSVLNRFNCEDLTLSEFQNTLVPLTPTLYCVSMPQCQMQVEWSKDHITFHLELDGNTKSARLLFLHDRYIVCHFSNGELSDHRFKDLDIPGFLLVHSEPRASCSEQAIHLQMIFACPTELKEIPCFFEVRTETSSAYVPLRFVLGDCA